MEFADISFSKFPFQITPKLIVSKLSKIIIAYFKASNVIIVNTNPSSERKTPIILTTLRTVLASDDGGEPLLVAMSL